MRPYPVPSSPPQSFARTPKRFQSDFDDDDDDDGDGDSAPGKPNNRVGRRVGRKQTALIVSVPKFGPLGYGNGAGTPPVAAAAAELDSSSEDDLDMEYRDKKSGRMDPRFGRNAHGGLVLSPSIPSFVNLQSTPETATPSPMANTASFDTPVKKMDENNGGYMYPIVKTRSMPYFRVIGMQRTESLDEGTRRISPPLEEKSTFRKPERKNSANISGSATLPADMHKMASSLESAKPRPAQASASFMTALQKPVNSPSDSEPPQPQQQQDSSARPAAAAAPNPKSPTFSPPLVHARSPSSIKPNRRGHFFSSSLSNLPAPKEEKKSDSDSGSSSEKEDSDAAASVSRVGVSTSSKNLARESEKSPELPSRDPTPTPKTKIRLFNIFSPMFIRFRRKRNRHHHEKDQTEHQTSKSLPASLRSSESSPCDSQAACRSLTTPEAEMRKISLEDSSVTSAKKTDSLPSISVNVFKDHKADAESEKVQEEYDESGFSRSTDEQGTSSENYTNSRDSVEAHADPEQENYSFAETGEDESKSTFDDFLEFDDDEEVEDDDDDDDDEESFDPYVFMGRLERFVQAMPEYMRSTYFVYPNCVPLIGPKDANAPLPTLVLDLDETLVHCSVEPVASPDFIFPVSYDGADFRVHAYRRPHLRAFLKAVSRMYEVVLFTASLPQYAEALMNIMDPNHEIFSFGLYRNSCVQGFGSFIKDLSLLGRDLAKTVIIDNSPQAFSFQPDNGIPIRSYFDSKDDCELSKLIPFLQRLSQAEDVRPLLRQRFKVSAKIEHAMSLGKQP